jgi:hypothetical protein
MTVAAKARVNLSLRAAAHTRHDGTRQDGQPDVVRRVGERRVRRIGQLDRRRPAPLAASPVRAVVRSCEPRVMVGSVGWLVLVGALVFVVVLGIGWFSGGPDAGSVPDRTAMVQVHRGETLWSVAERMAPAAAPAAVVDRIRQLNGLDVDSVLFPGELLQVPSGLTGGAEVKAGAVQR